MHDRFIYTWYIWYGTKYELSKIAHFSIISYISKIVLLIRLFSRYSLFLKNTLFSRRGLFSSSTGLYTIPTYTHVIFLKNKLFSKNKLFPRNKLFSRFENSLFLQNSLFFKNRITTMVTALPSLLKSYKSIMVLPATQDKNFITKTFFSEDCLFLKYDITMVYGKKILSAISTFKNFIYFLDHQISRHIWLFSHAHVIL